MSSLNTWLGLRGKATVEVLATAGQDNTQLHTFWASPKAMHLFQSGIWANTVIPPPPPPFSKKKTEREKNHPERQRARDIEKCQREKTARKRTDYANDVRHSVSSSDLLAPFGVEPHSHLDVGLALLVRVVLGVLRQLLHVKQGTMHTWQDGEEE